MDVYDKDFNPIDTYDENFGRLVTRQRIIHYDYVAPVEEVWHYEIVAEYPNGGKEVAKVIDVAEVEEVLEHDEVVECLVYELYSEEELAIIERNKNAPTLIDIVGTLTKDNEELKEQNEMLIECILEMSEIIYQ